MFSQVHHPEHLTGHDLDSYLEKGWFRMGQTIFTTNFHRVNSEIYSTIWLRLLLTEYSGDKTQEKLYKKNSTFKTIVRAAEFTLEKEELYTLYRQSLSFSVSQSLQHLLFSEKSSADSVYNTFEVCVYDQEQLIACGFFDLGETSAQGIVSFYNPAYKKYSLGKYLIYSKIQYCKSVGLQYFYPGYFVPGNPGFDYKLEIGRSVLEFLQLRSNTWLPISTFTPESIPFMAMQNKLTTLNSILKNSNTRGRLLKYEFFDVNLIPQLRNTDLFEFPVFLFFRNETEENSEPIVVYDVRDNLYHLLIISPVLKSGEIDSDVNFYSRYVLKTSYEILASANEKEIASLVMNLLKI